MNRHEFGKHRNDRCIECGAPITVEMSGPWSYRVCTINGHVQPSGIGPLASAAALFPAR